MKNKILNYSQEVADSLNRKDYKTLLSLFEKERFSPSQLSLFYKQNQKLFSDKKFWNSELPHFYLSEIVEGELKVKFLKSYLSNEKYCNHELNKHLFYVAANIFIQHIKLWGAFTYVKFIDSFKRIANVNPELLNTINELIIINKALTNFYQKKNEYIQSFLQFSFDQILLAFVLFYDKMKQDGKFKGNKSFQTQIETSLIDELNNLISLLKENSKLEINFLNNEVLQSEFYAYTTLYTKGKNGIQVPQDNKYKLLFELIDCLIEYKSRKVKIDLYLCGHADFESIENDSARLLTNKSYRDFNFNNLKSQPEELYLVNYKDNPNSKSHAKTDISSCLNIFEFYGIPMVIEDDKTKTDMEKVFELLNVFSYYKGPKESNFLNVKEISIDNNEDKRFFESFGANESISVFDLDLLKKGITEYFIWNKEDIDSILTFLTFDFKNEEIPINWVSKPFLKFGNKVMWIGAFLKDRRWDNILFNRLKKEDEHSLLRAEISKNFEMKIGNLFNEKGFKTFCGLKFKSFSGESGEIDVLAFKDNTLFVCEAKSGNWSDDYYHASYSETLRLEGCAAEQLIKCINYINESSDNIKDTLGLPKELKIDSIEIVPLIITNYFEGDLRLYKENIRKISLLELDVILKNKKRDLLDTYFKYFLMHNISNKNLLQKINWDVWGGSPELNAKTIIKTIDDNLIWKEYKSIVNVSDINYTINF